MTKEEKAKEYALQVAGGTGNLDLADIAGQAYMDGYNEALRWRDVNEELPKKNKIVLVKDSGEYYFTAHISIHGWVNDTKSVYCSNRVITHWRPIE